MLLRFFKTLLVLLCMKQSALNELLWIMNLISVVVDGLQELALPSPEERRPSVRISIPLWIIYRFTCHWIIICLLLFHYSLLLLLLLLSLFCCMNINFWPREIGLTCSRFRHSVQGSVADRSLRAVARKSRRESGLRLRPPRGRHLVVRLGKNWLQIYQIDDNIYFINLFFSGARRDGGAVHEARHQFL